MLLWQAQKRAKKRGLAFDLTKKRLLELWKRQNGKCAISKIDMTHAVGDKAVGDFNVSIDRINAGGPYTIDNIQLVCNRVNWIRGDLDMATLNWWIQVLSLKKEP